MNPNLVSYFSMASAPSFLLMCLLLSPEGSLLAQGSPDVGAFAGADHSAPEVKIEVLYTSTRRSLNDTLDRGWTNVPKVGSTVGVLLRLNGDSLVEVLPGGCTLKSLKDEKGTDLMMRSQSTHSFQQNCTYSHKTNGMLGNLAYVEFHGSGEAAAGAAWVEVSGKASVMVSDSKELYHLESIRLEHRRQYTVGGVRIGIKDGAHMQPPDASVTDALGRPLRPHLPPIQTDGFLLMVDETQGRLESLKLVASDGSETIEAKLERSQRTETQHSSIFSLQRPASTGGYTLEVEVYPNLREVELPIELRAPLASLGGTP